MTTATLNPTADAWIISNLATNNYDTSTQIGAGERNDSVSVRRTVIKFDLSGIPASATINSATLRLYCTLDYATNARTYRVYRLKVDYHPTQVTWNIRKTGTNWQTAGGFGADDCEQTDIGSRDMTASETLNEYKEWTLTASKIEEMIDGTFTNNGFLILADTESDDCYVFNSVDVGTNSPELVIDYTLPGGRQFQAIIIG